MRYARLTLAFAERDNIRHMNVMVKGRLSILVLVLAAAFALLAVACSNDDEEDLSDSTTETPAPLGTTPTPPSETTACPVPINAAPELEVKKFDAKPELTIDTSKTYTATVKTERGDITIALRADLAPEHVNSLVFLAREGYYDGTREQFISFAECLRTGSIPDSNHETGRISTFMSIMGRRAMYNRETRSFTPRLIRWEDLGSTT